MKSGPIILLADDLQKAQFFKIARKKTLSQKSIMDYVRLMVICTIISRDDIGEKIPRWKYERYLSNI